MQIFVQNHILDTRCRHCYHHQVIGAQKQKRIIVKAFLFRLFQQCQLLSFVVVYRSFVAINLPHYQRLPLIGKQEKNLSSRRFHSFSEEFLLFLQEEMCRCRRQSESIALLLSNLCFNGPTDECGEILIMKSFEKHEYLLRLRIFLPNKFQQQPHKTVYKIILDFFHIKPLCINFFFPFSNAFTKFIRPNVRK